MKSLTMQSWVTQRGLEDLDLGCTLKSLQDQTLIEDRDIVISRIAAEISAGGNIILASDYDVDGITAGVILSDVIGRIGGRVTMVTASRFGGGGYGLSSVLCDKVLALSPALVITADFGSSDHDRLQRLKDEGVDTLVIDHHLVPDRPLPALGFLNPHKPTCSSTFKHMCSGGLAWSVAGGLLKKFGLLKQIDITQYLQLVALSTIADVMPLIGDNRVLVKLGLEKMRSNPLPGIRELMRLGKIDLKYPLTGRNVGWQISPMINAPGRIGSADIIPRLLLSKDVEEIEMIGAELQQIAISRRELTLEIQEEAEKRIEAAGWQHAAGIVVGAPEWGHGIVGITAGRLVDKYKVPCAVFGSEGKGSVRGPAGSKLHTALTLCQEHLKKFGGHQAAAGAEIAWQDMDSFREAWSKAIIATSGESPFIPDDISLKVDPKDSLGAILRDLELLEPCGQGNPRPQFVIEGVVDKAREVKGGHLSMVMHIGNGIRLKGFHVGEGEKANSLLEKKAVWKGDLRPTSYGREGVEMFIESLDNL